MVRGRNYVTGSDSEVKGHEVSRHLPCSKCHTAPVEQLTATPADEYSTGVSMLRDNHQFDTFDAQSTRSNAMQTILTSAVIITLR